MAGQGHPFDQVEQVLWVALLDPASAFEAALDLVFVAGLALSLFAFVLLGSQILVGYIGVLWAAQVVHNLTFGFALCNFDYEEQPFLDA